MYFTSRNPRQCYPQGLRGYFSACFGFNLQLHSTSQDLEDMLKINTEIKRESKKTTFLVDIFKWEIKKRLKKIME